MASTRRKTQRWSDFSPRKTRPHPSSFNRMRLTTSPRPYNDSVLQLAHPCASPIVQAMHWRRPWLRRWTRSSCPRWPRRRLPASQRYICVSRFHIHATHRPQPSCILLLLTVCCFAAAACSCCGHTAAGAVLASAEQPPHSCVVVPSILNPTPCAAGDAGVGVADARPGDAGPRAHWGMPAADRLPRPPSCR